MMNRRIIDSEESSSSQTPPKSTPRKLVINNQSLISSLVQETLEEEVENIGDVEQHLKEKHKILEKHKNNDDDFIWDDEELALSSDQDSEEQQEFKTHPKKKVKKRGRPKKRRRRKRKIKKTLKKKYKRREIIEEDDEEEEEEELKKGEQQEENDPESSAPEEEGKLVTLEDKEFYSEIPEVILTQDLFEEEILQKKIRDDLTEKNKEEFEENNENYMEIDLNDEKRLNIRLLIKEKRYPRKFKNKDFVSKIINLGKGKSHKSLKQICNSKFDRYFEEKKSYGSIETCVSVKPPIKYWDLSGYRSKYTEKTNGLRFYDYNLLKKELGCQMS